MSDSAEGKSHPARKSLFWAWVLVVVAGLFMALLFVDRGTSHGSHRSYVRVSVTPFPKAMLDASFPAKVFQTLPGVRFESNGADLVTVTADGVTAEDAEKRCKDATTFLGAAVQKDYGARLSILDSGDHPVGIFRRVAEKLGF